MKKKMTDHELADSWIKEMEAAGLSPDQMLEVIKLAKVKHEYYRRKRLKSGIELIALERLRQIEVEGFDKEHDDEHNDQSLLGAAVCYAEHTLMNGGQTHYNWPWSRCLFKPTNGIRNLVKAGALIAAEIDRVQR